MKRFIQATLVTVAAVAGLVGLGLLAINLYVQSPGTQLRLREVVSDNLGYPISVFRITFTPWNGLHLEDVSIRDPSLDYPILKARDLWIQCNYLPLLRRKLIVRRVFLSGAEIRIPTAERGESEPGVHRGGAGEAITSRERAGAPSASAAKEPVTRESAPQKSPSAEKPVPEKFWVEVRQFKIRQGSVYLIGPNGIPAVTFRDVEGSVQSHKGEYIGKVRISSSTLFDSVNVEDIFSQVKCSNGSVDLDDISAKISGGEIHGNYHVDLTRSDLPYQVHLQITGVNINEIVSRVGGIFDRAHGTLEGSLQVAGHMKDPSLASGRGSLEIKTGYLDQYPILKELGRWTQIDELQRLDLQEAISTFSIAGQDIKVDSLEMISKNCQVNLWGTVESAQKLDLNGRLTVSQFLSQKIPNELEDNFVQSKDGRTRYLDFRVRGSLLRPQTDLFERIVGDKSKLIKKLLRTDRKEKRREQPPADPEPSGTPTNG